MPNRNDEARGLMRCQRRTGSKSATICSSRIETVDLGGFQSWKCGNIGPVSDDGLDESEFERWRSFACQEVADSEIVGLLCRTIQSAA